MFLGNLEDKSDDEIETLISEMDKKCVENNLPILISCLLMKDDDTIGNPIFWESVEQYDIRNDGENDPDLFDRIRIQTFAYIEEHGEQLATLLGVESFESVMSDPEPEPEQEPSSP